MVHLPLMGLLFAAVFDVVTVQTHSSRWRDAATALWWLGLLGAAAAITTGLIAYNRVEHSDTGHAEMVLHRNLALASVTVLLITAVWRWRRPYSRAAALVGLLGALGLWGRIPRRGPGVPPRHRNLNRALEQVAHERGGHGDRARPHGLRVWH